MQGAVFGALPRGGNTVSDEMNETQNKSGSAIRQLVECDEHCGAFLEPITIEEYRQALEHWMDHQLHGGCSHGT